MKFTKRIFSIFLILLTFLNSVIVCFSDNTEEITFYVETINDVGTKKYYKEKGYYDGEKIYVSTTFFEKYTFYNYYSDISSFVRTSHNADSKFGTVTIDYTRNVATLHMNGSISKDYNLKNIYTIDNVHYLPLDQMSSLLKSSILISGNIISVANSGYSISDAEYFLNSRNSDGKFVFSLIPYNYTNIVDDIYNGNEILFYTSAVLRYFTSTIFDLRISQLDVFFHLGDTSYYKDFFEKCITDDDVYYDNISNSNNLKQRVHQTQLLNSDINEFSNKYKELTGIIKKWAEPVKDTSLNNALLYTDAKDWNALFSSISTTTAVADYYLKAVSVLEDHVKMMDNYFSYTLNDMDTPMLLASYYIKERFDFDVIPDLTANICKVIAEELLVDGLKEVTEEAINSVLPVPRVIEIVNAALKILGFDLQDNGEYSILLEMGAAQSFAQEYFDIPTNFYSTYNSVENARISTIQFLTGYKQVYKSANTLAEARGAGIRYDNKIELIDTLLTLYYLAAQSGEFDSFQGIENVWSLNETELLQFDIYSTETPEVQNTEDLSDIALQNLQNDNTNNSIYKQGQTLGDYTYFIDNTDDRQLCRINNLTGDTIIIEKHCNDFCVTSDYVIYSHLLYDPNNSNYYQGHGGYNYCKADHNGDNKVKLYHSDYTMFGSAVGEPPGMLVTNEYIYIDKEYVIKINIETGHKQTIFKASQLKDIAISDMLPVRLIFVYDDTYYFEAYYLVNNYGKAGYYKYHKSTGFEKIIDIEDEINNSENQYSTYEIMSSSQKKVLTETGISFYYEYDYDPTFNFTPSETIYYDFTLNDIVINPSLIN